MRYKFVIIAVVLFINAMFAQDIKLKIPESSINNLFNAFLTSKYLSYGHIDNSQTVDYYSFKPKSVSLNIQPNNMFSCTIVADATANFNLIIFDFDKTLNDVTVNLSGTVELNAVNTGYKITFVPTALSIQTNSWLDIVINYATSGYLAQHPEFSTTVNCPMLSGIAGQYFTSTVPTLSTTDNEVILGLILLAGPRFITVHNDINQRWDIGTIENLENSSFISYNSPKTFEWNSGDQHQVQTPLPLLDASNGKNKYRQWFNRVLQTQSETAPRRIQIGVSNNDDEFKAKFDPAKRVQLSNSLEGVITGGTVTYDNVTGSPYDDYDFFSAVIQHSVNSSVPNGTLGTNWLFKNWSDNITTQQRTVVVNNDVNLTAIYKGTHISNSAQGFSSNSQRKIVKTGNGVLHMVYESMDRVWYERSSDNGTSWVLMNNGNPLSDVVSVSPSIDYVNNDVAIAWSEIGSGIKIAYFPGSSTPADAAVRTAIVSENVLNGTTAHPVIALGRGGDGMVVWEQYLYLLGPKLGYANFSINTQDGYLFNKTTEGVVPGTTSSSMNPSLSYSRHTNGGNDTKTWQLAWQENSIPSIMYQSCTFHDVNPFYTSFSGATDISSYQGLDVNTNPSLVAFGTGARVCWFGRQDDDTYTVFHDPEAPMLYWLFSGAAGAPVIAKQSVLDAVDNFYCFGWSTGNSSVYATCKLNGMTEFQGFTGPAVQMVNGFSTSTTSPVGMSAINFKNAALPYSFAYCAQLPLPGPIIIDKTSANAEEIRTGRKGLIQKDSAQFSFSLGDISCENKPVEFKTMTPEEQINNVGDLNTWIQTKPFTVTDNSTLLYSIQFGVNDSNKAAMALADGRSVSFTVQLIDDNTNRVIWDCDNVTYDRLQLQRHDKIANEMSLDGIGGTKTVRLALKVSADSTVTCVLANMFAQGSVLQKARTNKKVLGVNAKVTTYALSQNYPNPFNPTTVINYQLPKAGRVTLRVYDMLGKEVVKLVDEEKSAGQYQAEFNASRLSSGVYFYQIECNDFKAIKKMSLIK